MVAIDNNHAEVAKALIGVTNLRIKDKVRRRIKHASRSRLCVCHSMSQCPLAPAAFDLRHAQDGRNASQIAVEGNNVELQAAIFKALHPFQAFIQVRNAVGMSRLQEMLSLAGHACFRPPAVYPQSPPLTSYRLHRQGPPNRLEVWCRRTTGWKKSRSQLRCCMWP